VKRFTQPMLQESADEVFHPPDPLKNLPVFLETIPERLENARVTNYELTLTR